MRRALLILGLLAASCAQPAPDAARNSDTSQAGPGSSPDSPRPAASPASSRRGEVATLAGEWRVAGIDGATPEGSVGLALSADANEIWWEPRCAGIVHRYRIDGFDLTVTPPSEGAAVKNSIRQSPPPPAVCAIGLPPGLGEVNRAMRAAVRIERTEHNGVLLSGGGHSLLLFSQ